MIKQLTNNLVNTFTLLLSVIGMIFWLYCLYNSLSIENELNIIFSFLGYIFCSGTFWKYTNLIFKKKNELMDSWL